MIDRRKIVQRRATVRLMRQQIKSTTSHYNSENRNRGENAITGATDSCQYMPLPGKEGCAFYRIMPEHIKSDLLEWEETMFKDDRYDTSASAFIEHAREQGIWKGAIATIPSDFYVSLQMLHDTGNRWNQNGLSAIGKLSVYNIKKSMRRWEWEY